MFRERNPVPLGVIVIVWLVALVGFVLNVSPIVNGFGASYTAQLSEAAGLKQGDPVVVSGLQVGRVSSVELGEKGVLVDFAVSNGDISLGELTTARVGVATVLGDKSLILTSEGDGSLAQGSTIPLSRTTSPYDISQALSQLTTETGVIDVDTVAKALETVSVTLDQVSPELRDAINGVGRLSQTISSRDATLRSLLSHAGDFSQVLADRSDDLTTLIRQGNILFGELLTRRDDVETLLGNVSRMSQSLSAVVDANAKNLKPTLESLNEVLGVLRQNKQNISKALDGLAVYATGLGEVVSSGPFFTAYLQNLLPGNFVPPDLDLTPLTGGGQ